MRTIIDELSPAARIPGAPPLAMTMKRAFIRTVLVLCVAATGADAQSGDSAMARRLHCIQKAHNVPALGAAASLFRMYGLVK
jgi:hypothetical protein